MADNNSSSPLGTGPQLEASEQVLDRDTHMGMRRDNRTERDTKSTTCLFFRRLSVAKRCACPVLIRCGRTSNMGGLEEFLIGAPGKYFMLIL